MNTYKSEAIRNVAILGHGGCGKTTLVEAIALTKGIISRQGRVEEGNTISDYDKEEIKRTFSISTSLIPVEHDGIKINFLDCPGYFDFVGEVEEALDAAGAAIIVVNAKAGVEVGTIKAWEMCEKKKLPRCFFVTAMDDPNANFANVVEQLTENFGTKVAPFHTPFFENEKFVGFVNVVKMGGRKFTKGSEYTECDIPDSVKDDVELCRHDLLEAIAESSEELMEKYFAEEEFTQEEIDTALHATVFDGSTVPVLAGAAINQQGTVMLLNAIKSYFPSPLNHKVVGKNVKDDSEFAANYDINKPMTAKVFKTIVNPFIGKYSMIKVCSGVLTSDATIYNSDKDTEEKLS
ncbi:MAG: GTP-binding protein, partial [Lachnospiraceae bacterium]|nr:GTP-binding protein [Lachnospiraceae bacterium]